MATPQKLHHPGQRPGESLWNYLIRKRFEESQIRKLGIRSPIYGLGGQEPTLTDVDVTAASPSTLIPEDRVTRIDRTRPSRSIVPERTKEKTVITRVDDDAVPDKVVTTIEQAPPPPDTTAAADTGSAISRYDAPEVTAVSDSGQTTPDITDQAVLQDLIERYMIDNPGVSRYDAYQAIKNQYSPTPEGVTGSPNPWLTGAPGADPEGLVTTTPTGRRLRAPVFPDSTEEEGILSYAGPNIAERITEETVTPPTPKVDKKAKDKPKADASTVNDVDVKDVPPDVKAELEREWGKWTYKPRERRDKFMGQLNRIYMKGAMLDAIAAFSGGQSRSGAYIERAMGKLNAITKFDQEERVYNIWRDVYYKNGVYDPPKTKKEAAMRARRLGANPEETKSIYGWAEEGQDLKQWWRPADNAQGYEVTQTSGKKEAPAKGSGVNWQQGSVPTALSAPSGSKNRIYWTNGEDEVLLYEGITPESLGYTGEWKEGRKEGTPAKVPGGKPEIDFIENVYANNGYGKAGKAAAVEALVARMRVDPGIYGLMGKYTDDRHRESAVLMVDNWIREYEARGREPYSSQGRPGSASEAVESDVSATGSEKSYTSEADFKARAESEGVKSGHWVIVAGKRRQVN